MTLVLAPDVTVTRAGDGLVLLDARAGRYWQLNGSAAAVLDALLAGGSVDEAVTDLRSRFPEREDRIGPDTERFLAGLRSRGLVTS